MNRITTTTPRKPTQRAFEDWRTTWAARSGVSSTARTDGADVNRSTGATSAGDRAGIDGQNAGAVDGDREAIHPARSRAIRGTVGLYPEPVVTRAVARAL